jgi:dienelactone hydrolase
MSYQRALAFACASALAPGLAAAQSAGAHAPGGPTPALHRPHRAELAGRALAGYPFFERVRALHAGSALQMAVDPLLLPQLAGSPADVYVVAAKSAAEWQSDGTLVDVRAGGPQAVLFGGGGVQGNTFTLDPGLLSGDAGTGLGVPYDVVIDTDFDGLLGDADVIDGAGAEAGFYVVRDTTLLGPLVPIELTYDLSPSTFDAQNTFYPANIAALGKLPVVIVSHGNGHNYQWYDHIGRHLASYGYVVMSHENNTGPGSDAASITTLTNAEKLFANQATIGGGVLNGHLDANDMVFIGHSRGGEGVVRAYTRLVNDEFTTSFFDQEDIRLVVSISPVTHIDSSLSDPGTVNYALMYGAADADVTGTPSLSASKPFAFYERAEGDKSVFYIQGVGHAYFHNGGGTCVCTGPAILPLAEVHDYELGYLLALVKRYVDGNVPARDFLERMEGDLRPLGVVGSAIASKEYREGLSAANFVIDDFQTNFGLALSSSGGAVSGNVQSPAEDLMRDQDDSFVYSAAVSHNGMTRYDDSGDTGRCAVFEWSSPGSYFYEFALVPAASDLSDDTWLSLRACQGTRHPATDLLDGPLSFTVTLRDVHGTTSSILTSLYGDITRTYERTGSGIGAGWANEFSTVRLRLSDFAADGSGLDLSAVAAVRLEFGAGFGSVRGRLGLDDLEIVRD